MGKMYCIEKGEQILSTLKPRGRLSFNFLGPPTRQESFT